MSAALIAAAIVTSAAHAHGIWFAERSNELALVYGVGADDLNMVKRRPLIKSVTAYDDAGNPVAVSLVQTDRLLLVNTDSNPAVVAAILDNGTWTKTTEGEWLKKTKDEVPNAAVSTANFKYAVHIRAPLRQPIGPIAGHTLQVVPVDKALPELLGQPLKLRITYGGEPVAGARVLADYVTDPDAQPAISEADGSVTIKVRNQGLNVVTAIFDAPAEDPKKADKVEHLATLSFVLPHAPE